MPVSRFSPYILRRNDAATANTVFDDDCLPEFGLKPLSQGACLGVRRAAASWKHHFNLHRFGGESLRRQSASAEDACRQCSLCYPLQHGNAAFGILDLVEHGVVLQLRSNQVKRNLIMLGAVPYIKYDFSMLEA